MSGSSATSGQLAWLDQLAFELFRATGRRQLIQCLWVFDRDIDMAGLGRMRDRLAAMPFNRLVERSPLPGGRPRWVKPATPSQPIIAGANVLPRSQLWHWANAEARHPLDPVAGPAWRISVQRFDDGATAVSGVVSHLLIDGMGCVRIFEAAAKGEELASGYDRQSARSLFAAWRQDGRQILGDLPLTLAALGRIAREGWLASLLRKRSSLAVVADEGGGEKEEVDLPSLALSIPGDEWDACSRRLGGGANALAPALVAALAARLGRCRRSDGAVCLMLPVNKRRGLGDERALAIEFRKMVVSPAGVSQDLRPVNGALLDVMRNARQGAFEALEPLLPAVAWLPRRFATALADRLFSYGDEPPVSCSNIGTLSEALGRIDGGAPCARLLARAVDVNVSRRDLLRSHGHLVVIISRYRDSITLSIEACELEPEMTTTEQLRALACETLTEFQLTARFEL